MRIILLALLALLITACPDTESEWDAEGIVIAENIHGCWGIVTPDGTSYEPIILSDEFKIDGLEVYFNFHIEDEI